MVSTHVTLNDRWEVLEPEVPEHLHDYRCSSCGHVLTRDCVVCHHPAHAVMDCDECGTWGGACAR